MTDKRLKNYDDLIKEEPDLSLLNRAYALLSTNFERATSQLAELADRGSILSMIYLGEAYQRSQPKNLDAAEKWYRKAYENGAAMGLFALGLLHFQKNNYAEAETLFQEGAENDDELSMFWLAKIYAHNDNFDKNRYKIRLLLEKSASKGNVSAKSALAFSFMKGRYGLGNIPKGIWLYLSSLLEAAKIAIKNPDDPRLWH
ncbi:hypothetical protein HDIA_P0022 (plasmid) [Hartmannibacter diazotrophicus]|uniref:Sel1 repeat family protein n=1 Tax=Hartmannibacter diazotrophicus TaxID=1482074 RepID=A0A2C9DED7_9HYPH|nr:sel1 repeat family protein [Hartmannibacter diazotrophicus]SON58431.1 hypothetical protein HDIA_P0022 [Hartmannibacter diazotrophicus]